MSRNNSTESLFGDGCFLRLPQPDDMAEFLAVVQESREFHQPWATPPSTPDLFLQYLGRGEEPGFMPFVLCALPEGKIAGSINLSNICLGNFCSACLGYWIGVHHQGRGLMTAGIHALLEDCFLNRGLHRIEANVQPGNEQSKKLLTRLRFRLEGFSPRFLRIDHAWKDHERWAITAEEFSAGERFVEGAVSPK